MWRYREEALHQQSERRQERSGSKGGLDGSNDLTVATIDGRLQGLLAPRNCVTPKRHYDQERKVK